MADIEREPCPRCGEPAALVARVCPHCHGSALVDVFVEQRVVDPRQRYQVARALVGLGLPGASLTAIQSALGLPGMPVARGLTRADARLIAASVAEQGIRMREEPARERTAEPPAAAQTAGRASRGGGGWRLGVALGLLVFAALALRTTWREWPGRSTPSRGDAAPRARAAALTTRQIAERVTPSTVSLRCSNSVGAGFFVTSELVLTNAHVACEGSLIQAVFPDGRQLAAEVVKRDDWLDLAAFRVLGAKAKPLDLGDAGQLGPGDKVILIGSPSGLDFTVHEGIVSNAARDYLGVAYIQVDANINPGNSGGPLLDSQGQVVGIISMTVGKASGLGLALPINYAYSGDTQLVARPPATPESSAWPALLAKVSDADRREVEQWQEAFGSKLGILEARGDASNRVRVLGIRRFSAGTFPERMSVPYTVMLGGLPRCGGFASFQDWQSVDSQDSSSRHLLWLRRNDLVRGLYVSVTDVGLCAGDHPRLGKFELGFRDSDPRADRVAINWSATGADGEE